MKLLIGHQMIQNAIKNQAIPAKCFGSRPEHTAIQVSLSRCLVSDVAQQQKSSLAVALVDCLTCYDSVGHPTASLACQHLGVSQSILHQRAAHGKFFYRSQVFLMYLPGIPGIFIKIIDFLLRMLKNF